MGTNSSYPTNTGYSAYPTYFGYPSNPGYRPGADRNPTLSSQTLKIHGKPYFLERRLGSGGFGAVYEAKTADGRAVAVKVTMLQGGGPAQMESRHEAFLNEVSQLKRLRKESRHVVVIYDFDFDPRAGRGYIVMELGKETLSTLVVQLRQMTGASGSAIDPEMMKEFWHQMVSIVSTLHRNRIVHMDLKPENFILFGTTLKIADLGIARQASALHHAGLGTEGYGAPEVMEDTPGAQRYYSPKADIYSLGAILYFMVYGRPPFDRRLPVKPPPGRSLYPDRDLISMLHRTLERDPRKRADINEVARHPFTRK